MRNIKVFLNIYIMKYKKISDILWDINPFFLYISMRNKLTKWNGIISIDVSVKILDKFFF